MGLGFNPQMPAKEWPIICVVLSLVALAHAGQTLHLTVSPTEVLNLPRYSIATIVIHASSANTRLRYIYVESLQTKIAEVTGNRRFRISPEACDADMDVRINSSKVVPFWSAKSMTFRAVNTHGVRRTYRCFNATFFVKGVSIGRTSLAIYVGSLSREKPDTISNLIYDNYPVSVVRVPHASGVVLHWCLIAMVVITIFCLSCKVDVNDLVQSLKKPNAPLVSFAMMFLFKPLFSYALGTVFTIDKVLRMGVFALGCCPEGAVSLIWTHILGGDLSLGILISCGEAVLSFGAIPLSMVSLGRTILGYEAPIPFKDIAMNSAEVLIACGAGLLMRRFAPEVIALKLGRFARYFGTVTLVFLIFVNIFCNSDLFEVMGQWRVLACGTLLPGLGGLLGGVVAWACCHDWACVKSITLAIILQGIDVPMAIVHTSLPLADAQLAGIVPVIAALFANTALWPPYILRFLKQGCGSEEDVIIHTTNTTMSMKKKKFRAMFAMGNMAETSNINRIRTLSV